MSDAWRMSGRRERGREIALTNRQKNRSSRGGWGGGGRERERERINGNRCTRKAFQLRIVPERELIFLHDRPLHWIPALRCGDQRPRSAAGWRTRPVGPRTVTNMSKMSGCVSSQGCRPPCWLCLSVECPWLARSLLNSFFFSF